MASSHLTVRINKISAFSAGKNFTLLFREEFVAVSTLVQVVLVLFQKEFQLFHEQATHDFVFSFL